MNLAANPLPAETRTTEPRSLLGAFEKAEIGEGCRDWRILPDGGIEFACDHDDPLLLVSDVEIESHPAEWIHVEIMFDYDVPGGVEIPKRLHAQLFFNDDRSCSFVEQRAVVDALDPSATRHRAHFRLRTYRPTEIRQFRFDPVNAPGRYRIVDARAWIERRDVPAKLLPLPRLAPVVSMGRSGGTLLVELLSLHPEIMTNDQPAYESWILAYFVKLYELIRQTPLHRDHEDLRRNTLSVAEGGGLARPHGFADGLNLDDLEEEYARFLTRYLPKLLASSAYPKYDQAAYFVEKFHGTLVPPMMDLFPDAKVIGLFRDPRRVLLSQRAFEAKNDYRAWSNPEGDARAMIQGIMGYSARTLRYLADDPEATRIVGIRYEDLIREPAEVMETLCDFLELECPGSYLDAVLDHQERANKSDFFRKHQTSGSVEASLGGSWDGITDEEREAFLEYREIFEILGYEV